MLRILISPACDPRRPYSIKPSADPSSQPSPHAALVLEVRRAEGGLELCFLGLDEAVLDDGHESGDDDERSERAHEDRGAEEDAAHAEVHRVAREAVGAAGDQGEGWLVRMDVGAGAAE